jgi:hypothetical protein
MCQMPTTPEQLLYLIVGLCGLIVVFWMKWENDRQGGLEKSTNWLTYMVPSAMLIAVEMQLMVQLVMNRMGA